jgi:hypothetical protein
MFIFLLYLSNKCTMYVNNYVSYDTATLFEVYTLSSDTFL